ncbi:MAG: hypothetical protein JSV49_00800 [Thermoplasmata archaeon]|nr:MAG: hypothetical protein JSV49_00800 [Thermoplasmata archaeon]
MKSVLHVQFTIDGNTVVMNYANQLKGYTAGSTSISSQECNEEFDSNNHYPVVYSDMDSTLASDFADDWNYLPSLKKSNLTNSFEAFSPDNAMTSYILPLSGVNDYLNNYPEAYVTTAYCNRTDGELIWNVTFGSKDEPNGYNVLVSESGVKYDMAKTIDPPRNGTDDLWPVLTFAGSEYIFKNLDDDDINVNIFTGGSINFDSASYGITADLSYPTVDFTSVTNFQTQKLAYYAATKDGSFITALDAETGQLLFKLKHEYTGIDIPI